VLERGQPLAVRRRVCFAEAVLSGENEVEGVLGVLVAGDRIAAALAKGDVVPVTVDPEGRLLATLRPQVVVDARMLKRAGEGARDDALLVGLGPGFVAGQDADAVIETQRGPDLGRVIWSGPAQEDSGSPASVAGVTEARVLRAPCSGTFAGSARIGDLVTAGAAVGAVDAEAVVAEISGLLRGLIAEGVPVSRGMKLGDIDPRGRAVDPARISDKARAVAAGVLEAVMLGLLRRADGVAASAGERGRRR
jgi:xanthine dehydrogenase accessory factor